MKNCEINLSFEEFLNQNNVDFKITHKTASTNTYEVKGKHPAPIIIDLRRNGKITIAEYDGYYTTNWDPEDFTIRSYLLNLIY